MNDLKELIEQEIDQYLEWPTADKSRVTTVSAKLFAEHVARLYADHIADARNMVAPAVQGEAKGNLPAPMKIEHRAPGITIEKDILGTVHIKVGDFDYIQIRYQYPYTDNASQAAHARLIADALTGAAPQPAVQGEPVAWATRLYNTAYHAGHHDTVEGGYTHVYPQDMDSHHEDVVQEWLADNPQPAEQQPAPDEDALEHEVRAMVGLLANGEWAGTLPRTDLGAALECQITKLVDRRPARFLAALLDLLRDIGDGCQRREMPSEQTIAEWADRIDAALAAHRKGGEQT